MKKQKKNKEKCAKNCFDKFFSLSWKKLWIAVVTGFVAVLLHNGIDALFGFEEALFFIIAVFLVPLYLILAGVYTLLKFLYRFNLDRKVIGGLMFVLGVLLDE